MFKQASNVHVTSSNFYDIGRNQAIFSRARLLKVNGGPHGPDIELGYHSRSIDAENETDPIPDNNIPSDVDALSDGTLTPVSFALDDVHPASDEVFRTVPLSEHNTEPLRNNVVLGGLNLQASQTGSAELTNPPSIYLLDGAIVATFTPSEPSDAIEDSNDEGRARETRLRRGRIETRTNNAVNWLRHTYGSNDGLDQYMNQFDASDIILTSCAELRELCSMLMPHVLC
jgi:hypothetical protein